VFVETHPVPEDSVSDGQCLIPLDHLELLINKAKAVGDLEG